MLDEQKPAVDPPKVIVKSESEEPVPAEAVIAASHFARMGTRVPGPGDLGNTGPRERTWHVLPGVSVGARRTEEGEVVVEEECYSWTDLPMNKQGVLLCSFPFPLSPFLLRVSYLTPCVGRLPLHPLRTITHPLAERRTSILPPYPRPPRTVRFGNVLGSYKQHVNQQLQRLT